MQTEQRMKVLTKLKQKAAVFKKEILTVYYAYKHPDLKLLPKIFIIIALGYALSPIDLIPDFIPVLGYLDDLIIIPVLIYISLKLIPDDILIQSRLKAEKEPIQIKRNWFVAAIIILIWVIALLFIVFLFCKELWLPVYKGMK
jgi:uncharacterized membrane protein YkvA (DUF1232 family)